MNRFAIARPRTFEQASELLSDRRFSMPILKAGGMDVLDHLKEGLITPDLLIDVKRLVHNGAAERIGRTDDGKALRIEATTTLAEIVSSPIIKREAPVIAQALAGAATPQVRNVATAAGSLLQRPRCWYYRSEQFKCLKKDGDTCYAKHGENRYHAVFGGGPCVIVHPASLAPALHVLGGVVHLIGGNRGSLPIRELYHTPAHGVMGEHNLEQGEVITHITVETAPNSGFYAIKEKQSFDWPLVMAAAAIELDGDTIVSARLCAGAVAPVPWPLPAVEGALRGINLDDDKALTSICGMAVRGAAPLSDNAYKLKLLPVALRRAILKAAGQRVEAQS